MSSIGRVDGGSFHPADGGDNTPAPATGSEAPAAPPVTDRSGSGGGLLDVLSGLSSRVSSLFSDDRTDAAPAAAPHRPVTVSPEGRFTTTPGAEPGDLREVGAGLFAAASKIDDGAKNLFDVAGIDSARRGQILANLRGDLAKVPAGGAPPAGLDPLQADQLRSSGATVLLELLCGPLSEPPRPPIPS